MSIQDQPKLWDNQLFMRVFSSYSISVFGRWFDMVAIMILFSFIWETSPLVIALIPVMYALPHALLSQFSGIFADRFNKIKLMIIADSLTAALSLFLFFAPSPWIALPVLLLRATLTVIHFPAQQALIKHLVSEQLVVKAITWNGTVNELSKIVGPFIGGSLAAYFSPHICILIGAFAYLFSAFILLPLRNRQEVQSRTSDGTLAPNLSFWTSWKEGWYVVLGNKNLKLAILVSVIGYTAIQMMDVQITVLLREIAPDRPELLGWTMAASGVGALVTILVINQLNEIRSYFLLLGGGYLLIGTGFAGFGFLFPGISTSIPVLLGGLAGAGIGLFTIGISYTLQKESTEETIGRVSGIYSSITNMIVLVAPLIGGLVVSIWRAGAVYIGSGGFLIFVGLVVVLLTVRKKL